MLKLLGVELLKIRRSLALLMMFGIPLLVILLNAAMLVKQYDMHQITAKVWFIYWAGNTGMWCYFMMPLYIALITGLLNGHEHKNQTWRLMLTLPVSQLELFIVKGVLALLFVVGATLVLVAGTSMTVFMLGAAGASGDGAFAAPLAPMVWKVTLACLPILVIQHAVSWRFQNLVLPLALGVIATMGITQIGSSKYWVWYPWTYSMMGLHGSDADLQQKALLLAGVVGAVLFAACALVLGRREVES